LQNTEVFKTCLDYWNFFVPDIYSSACSVTVSEPGVCRQTHRIVVMQTCFYARLFGANQQTAFAI
jgi:hypothetical protein